LIKEGKFQGKYKLVDTVEIADSNKTYENLRTLWNEDAAALKQ
jgi:hypothetical protein